MESIDKVIDMKELKNYVEENGDGSYTEKNHVIDNFQNTYLKA